MRRLFFIWRVRDRFRGIRLFRFYCVFFVLGGLVIVLSRVRVFRDVFLTVVSIFDWRVRREEESYFLRIGELFRVGA